MRKDYTEIAVILDESGSMNTTASDAVGGYNNFLEEQKKIPGEARLTLVKFNDDVTGLYSGKDIKEVSSLEHGINYRPGGSTALLDAIGHTIEDLGKRLSAMTEKNRPEKVIVLVITDGEENASKHYSLKTIKEKIEHQRSKYKWEFLFFGANIDSIASGGALGVSNNFNFVPTSVGVRDMYCFASSAVSSYRTNGKIS